MSDAATAESTTRDDETTPGRDDTATQNSVPDTTATQDDTNSGGTTSTGTEPAATGAARTGTVSTETSATKSGEGKRRPAWWRRAVGSRALWIGAAAVVIVALAVAAGVFAWQAHDQRGQLNDLRERTANSARAQQVASDYAVAAARIDYRNFDPWFTSLRRNVAPRLADQFSASEPALRDLLGQLQWVSTGTLVGSDIASQNGSTYVVQVFVDVTTSNVQSPDGVKTTALYPITVDRNNWQITDISGGVAPLPGK